MSPIICRWRVQVMHKFTFLGNLVVFHAGLPALFDQQGLRCTCPSWLPVFNHIQHGYVFMNNDYL